MKNRPSLAIVGAGNLGLTFALLADHSGHYDVTLGVRTKQASYHALCEPGEEIRLLSPAEAVATADIVVLAVPDDSIRVVCEGLANTIPERATVLHCSGALSSDELAAASARGCATGSMHPLQSFPTVTDALDRIAGTYCYCEGDEEAQQVINDLCEQLDMHFVRINKSAKTLYHAAAVVACNYLSSLMDASLELAEHAGIERDVMWASLDPLVTATLQNIRTKGPEQALTGPIKRSDVHTVEQHLKKIAELPSNNEIVYKIYTSLGLQAIKMLNRHNTETSQIDRLDLLLNKTME